MTDHADLSRRLALAIGWPENSAIQGQSHAYVWWRGNWRIFDYRDPAVIWRVAEHFDCFPMRSAWSGKWGASLGADLFDLGEIACDTAAEAVARAVVEARG